MKRPKQYNRYTPPHEGRSPRDFGDAFTKIMHSGDDATYGDVVPIIDSVDRHSYREVRVKVASFAVEAAAKIKMRDEQKLALLGRAQELWGGLLAESDRAETPDIVTLRANMGIATLPSLGVIALDRKLPKPEVRKKSYTALLGVSRQSRIALSGAIAADDSYTIANVIGFHCVLAGTLLLQRDSIQNPTGQFAEPAFYTERYDATSVREGRAPHAWDVTVFDDSSDTLEVRHKLQIRNRHHIDPPDRISAEGITDVYLSEDLFLPGEDVKVTGGRSAAITHELASEDAGTISRRVLGRIEARTAQLKNLLV